MDSLIETQIETQIDLLDLRGPAWQGYAACDEGHSELFYAPNYFETQGAKKAREAQAKLICRGCPVLDECREYALETVEEHGVWGGLNERERRRLLIKRALDSQIAAVIEIASAS